MALPGGGVHIGDLSGTCDELIGGGLQNDAAGGGVHFGSDNGMCLGMREEPTGGGLQNDAAPAAAAAGGGVHLGC
jgi:hypothetical protein